MKVRRFTATSMQKALKIVRDEMGPDAVILSNHRVNGGVEVIVAQNYEPVSARTSAPIFDAENDDAHLPSPKFSQQQHAPAQATAANNPWPFLSDDEREDVQGQLQLQTQLEQLKIQRGEAPSLKNQQLNSQSKQSSMSSGQGHHQYGQHLSQQVKSGSELQETLQSIKQQRQESQSISAASGHNQKLIDDVRNELNDLKEMLKATAQQSHVESTHHAAQTTQASQAHHQPQNFVWKKFGPNNSLQAKFWQRLENMGFEEWLIYQMLHKVQSHEDEKIAWQRCLHELAIHIQVSPSDRLKRGGIYALVGPTGAGKTTSIAKMAVRFTLENDGAKVGLITMDNYRLAAHDQLRTLGQILGVPVQVADQEHTVLQCIQDLQECDLVLIDTAGLTPEHPMLKFQLDQLAGLKGRVHTLLTLPATSNSRVLRKVYHNYKAAGLSGCILTKIDEASSLGDAISILLESKLDLSYSTNGQRIPDDLHAANARTLVKQAVHVAQQEQHTNVASVAVGAWS